jgi:hypothetical protein
MQADRGDFSVEADGKRFFADGITVQSKTSGSSGSSDSTSIAGQGVWLLVVIAVAGTAFLAFVILFVARRRSAKRGKDGGRVVGSALGTRSQGGILNPLYADAGDGGTLKAERQTSMRGRGGRQAFENPMYEETGKVNPLFDGFVGLPEDHDGVYDEVEDVNVGEGEGFYQEMPGNFDQEGSYFDLDGNDDGGYLDVPAGGEDEGDASEDTGYLDVPAQDDRPEDVTSSFEEDSAMFGFNVEPTTNNPASADVQDGEDESDGGYLDVNDDEEDE